MFTVLFRPFVHSMSPVTSKVHWIRSSFLANHPNITINGRSADAEPEILTFFEPNRGQNLNVTVTGTKFVHFTSLCHPYREQMVEVVQYSSRPSTHPYSGLYQQGKEAKTVTKGTASSKGWQDYPIGNDYLTTVSDLLHLRASYDTLSHDHQALRDQKKVLSRQSLSYHVETKGGGKSP
jgi:hypothetical protein